MGIGVVTIQATVRATRARVNVIFHGEYLRLDAMNFKARLNYARITAYCTNVDGLHRS